MEPLTFGSNCTSRRNLSEPRPQFGDQGLGRLDIAGLVERPVGVEPGLLVVRGDALEEGEGLGREALNPLNVQSPSASTSVSFRPAGASIGAIRTSRSGGWLFCTSAGSRTRAFRFGCVAIAARSTSSSR